MRGCEARPFGNRRRRKRANDIPSPLGCQEFLQESLYAPDDAKISLTFRLILRHSCPRINQGSKGAGFALGCALLRSREISASEIAAKGRYGGWPLVRF